MCYCALKRHIIVEGIEIIVLSLFLLHMPANHLLQSNMTGRFSLLDRVLQYHAMRCLNSSEKWTCFCKSFPILLHRELFVMEKSTSFHLVSNPCTLSLFNWILNKSLKSRRASLVQRFVFPQKSVVMLCSFLFHVDSPLENPRSVTS